MISIVPVLMKYGHFYWVMDDIVGAITLISWIALFVVLFGIFFIVLIYGGKEMEELKDKLLK